MKKKIRVIELFAGIGAPRKALMREGYNFEIVDAIEIDKYAVKSYNAMYGENIEIKNICEYFPKKEDVGEIDLLFHGSPCQDFSLAGKQAGGDKDSGTRSSLMYETIRIVEKLKPKYVIWENVKNLLSKKHRHNFDAYLETMESLGYVNYYQVLNAKDYGIPQNRERVFTVSIRSDINTGFTFPEKQELKLRLKDMLEDDVDEKYYLSEKMIKYITADNEKWTGNNDKSLINKTVASAINTGEGSRRCDASNYISNSINDNFNLKEVVRKYGVFDTDKSKHQAGSVYDSNGISPTLDTMQGGYRQPCIKIKNNTKKGYLEAHEGDGINISSRMKYQRGNVQKESIQTLTTVQDKGVVVNDKPRKDIKELDKNCEYCGKQLERKRFNGRLEDFTVFSNRKYCNRECMKRDFLKIGEHNQSYSNAHTTARKINELILHKEMCELCGSDTNLDIHHIDGNWQNNNLDNLMCLCRSCHTKYERNKDKNELRIRKLTPLEVWRLMGFDDEDFEKAAFKKETSYIEGGSKCNAKLKIVNEKQRHLDMETYALCTTNDMLDMETPIQTKRKKIIENENNEKMQNVNIAIEMLGEVEQKECVTNIIKCGENTTILYTLMGELDQHHMAIIELGKRDKASIEKYMKITLEENLNPMKLYTISTLIEQIIKSKIYTCIVQKANIQGNIAIIEDCVKNLKMMKLLNLKMEYTTRLNSDTMLYKQAGNSIVVNVLEAIFENLLKDYK